MSHPSHAYLFVGPDRVGKRFAAGLFAQALECLEPGSLGCGRCRECQAVLGGFHPDVRVWDVLPNEKTFKIDQVRELIHAVSMQPYQGKRKVHIVAGLDAIAPAGANALLKTLEEPPPSTTLILVARELDTVLPTLISRCQVVAFGLTPVEAIAAHLQKLSPISDPIARELAFQSQGRIGQAIALAGEPPSAASQPLFPAAPGVDAMAWTDQLAALPGPEQAAALAQLLSWIRDAAWLATGGSWDGVRYKDQADKLAEQAAAVPVETWLAMAAAIEAAREQLERHANARLVFDRLGRELAPMAGLRP